MRRLCIIILISLFPAGSSAGTDHGTERADGVDVRTAAAVTDTTQARVDTTGVRAVRVGIYQNKPKLFVDENGTPSGIFVDVLSAIAERADWQVTWVPCTWSDCLDSLRVARIDLMPDVAWSEDRDAWMDFHADEVLESWSQIFANPGAHIEHWADLDGKRLAVLRGSIQEESLAGLIRGLGYATEFVPADSWEEAFDLVQTGAAHAAAPNHFFGNYFYREYGLERTSIVAEPQALYFAAAASAQPELLRVIDEHLAGLKSEPGSAYYASLTRWLERPAPSGLPSYFLWLLALGGGMLLWAGSTIYILRHRVRSRTRHLAEANRALTESERKFRSLFEHNAAVKLLVDPQSGRIVEANQAAVTYYGWPKNELLSRSLEDLAETGGDAASLQRVLASGGGRFEQRHRVRDGSTRDVEVFAAEVDIHDAKCLHMIVYDISEYRRMQEQLRQAQKMEAVGRLAGGVAHDFNNFLGVIIGHAELGLHNLAADGDASSPVRTNLSEILAAANKSKRVTEQLMAFARKSVTRPVVMDVNARIQDMYKILKRLIGEEIDLTWSPCGRRCAVRMDPSHLDQVLANLCVNARDAIRGVGSVEISTSCAATHICLSVRDDGCGMDAETVANIFEPFYTTKDVGHGTGLGLATVYGIVEQTGGRIDVESAPGEGTTFRIYLPKYVEEAGPSPSADDGVGVGRAADGEAMSSSPPQARGETILLVDDEAAIVDMTKLALETLGYEVMTAGSPGEALDVLERAAVSPALLMTDVVMPEMNGRDLATRVCDQYPHVRVLYMSGYTDNILEDRGVVEGDVHLIQKPFSMAELADKIREIMT